MGATSARRAVLALVLLALAAGATVAVSAGSAARRVRAGVAGRGSVATLYAGSLVNYMERDVGPAFRRADGYTLEGFGGGSTELAHEIAGGVRRGDLFVSASASADAVLEGSRKGNWVSWYSAFMASPLMLAYNPHSRFGAELARGVPWWKVLTQSGIRVGRTDPRLDPKGVLTVEAVDRAASRLHDGALRSALSSFEVFPEAGLVGRLQAGQLDAGFFYAVEAREARLPSVALSPVYKYAEYTLTILRGAPDPSGAAALVRFLLASQRRSSLTTNGLSPMTPQFHGSSAAVPSSLRAAVGAR